ncbi:MAG: ROK family protein, partial [Melioribacteraceae bacterium]|nr:ROK family protein [Melioribacteraceae bacterium]
VDLGGTNVRAGKVVQGEIIDIYSQKIAGNETKEFVVNQVIEAIQKVFDDSIEGIGVGVPSVVDVEKGIVYDVQNIPAWDEVNLKEILEAKFNVPVYINNDANCFVVGEKYFGIGQKYESIVGLIIGTGLGAGYYFHNRLFMGANCGAGEIGMVQYKESIFEDYCSGRFFNKYYNVNGDELLALAEKGDKKALEIFSEFGVHVGNAITIIIYMLDPKVIVLGGSVSKSYKYFKNRMLSVLKNIPYATSVKNLKIEVSSLPQIAVLGAAALYLESVRSEL